MLCSAVLIGLGSLYSQASSPQSQASPDFDGNGTVGFSDFVLLAEAFGSAKGDAGYDPRYDLNGDDAIGFGDFVIFASRFGEKVPVSGGDRDALVALYNATDGPNWEQNTNWLTEKDLSTWYGVSVVNGRVTHLHLDKNKLSGTIPPELGQLTKLEYLILSRNDLSGGIPPELGRLTNLERLDLSVNSLNGTIPAELGKLRRLKHLRFWVSGLIGEIPQELGQLTELETLDLSWNNDLTGPIPPELGQLTNLRVLELDINDLNGPIPTELVRLTNLTSLDLANNELTGAIPPELGQLTNLEELILDGNKLTGPIPPELGQLSSLKTLWLNTNPLGGGIPPELGQLANLTSLNLGYNELTGAIPPELGQLTRLQSLELGVNLITGTIPSELGKLSDLRYLFLGWNQLTGRIPSELGQLTELREIYFHQNNDLTGPLPESFTGLTLAEFHLHDTQVCIPQTAEFHAWLESIRVKRVGDLCVFPERDALVALFRSADGSNWKNKTNWLSTENLGEWYGVTAGADGDVTRLDLRGNNLRGTIPHQLGGLAHLRTLNLATNPSLSGPVPLGLTQLTLDSLAMDGTQLCGPPKAEFQAWFDRIPSRTEVSRCTETRADYYALVELYNGTDGLNWTNATNWASPAPLGDWHGVTTDARGRVTRLDLYENNLSGAIPRQLAQLTHLKYLDLGDSQITGVIPPELGQLTRLTYLNLFGNEFNGGIPPELGQLTNLTSLTLAACGLTGKIPPELGRLTNLEMVRLDGNSLAGNIPLSLGQLTNLSRLSLTGNRLTGGIPPELGKLTNLESLGLGYNRLTGGIPPALGRLSDLRSLGLSTNELTGSIPPDLGRLTNLRQLTIGDNQLTGEIPPELGRLTNLSDLLLDNNQLTGEIPSEMGQLTNLWRLYLDHNQLTGRIPGELGQLANVQVFSLDNNQLTGEIPTGLGYLANLQRLDLASNRLSGGIPAELGQLANLEWLDLSVNQLSGEIPPELGNLANLKSLDLAYNGALSGSLSHTFTNLNLETLRLKETLVCVPKGAEFQAWLREIPDSRVPNCDLMDLSTAYLTQATQSLEYPVSMVAGEAALLRVFVTAARDVDTAMPPVRATFYLDGAEVYAAEIEGRATSIPWQINEASLLNSANAVVPGSVVMPGLEMVVEIDPDRTLDPGLDIAARLPATGRTAVDVTSLPTFNLTLVPFLWIEDPDRSVLTEMEDLSSESDLFRLTRDVLPVSDFQLTIHEPVSTSVDPTGDSHETLLREAELIYAMEGARGHYMGIFRETGEGGLQGIAMLPGYVSLSILDENVIAHELGHNLNLFHAPGCGALGTDPDFPTGDGTIGAWGYDFLNETLVNPETSDLMTYCQPQWISEFSFSKALRHRYHEGSRREEAAYQASSKSLLLWGGLNGDKELFLEPAFVVDAPPSLPRMDGPYRLTGEAEDGSTVFDVTFGMAEIACGGEGRVFALILPVQPGWAGRLARVSFSGPEGVSTLDGEEGPAAALLLDRATGDVRGILRDWAEPAAKRAATTLGIPEPDLEVLVSRGIPDAASWTR
ncbi:MAG: leucine-rich repeat domain-containing protein [Gemmatimonadota bacterium]|nr:leucine-rich repeat domain-containing protein [Gemmatimonadota bacterium]